MVATRCSTIAAMGKPLKVMRQKSFRIRGTSGAFLFLIGLSPLLTAYYSILRGHDVFTTMIMLHWFGMVLLPSTYLLFYIFLAERFSSKYAEICRENRTYYASLLEREMKTFTAKIVPGLIGGLLFVIVVVGSYLFAEIKQVEPYLRLKDLMLTRAGALGLDQPADILALYGLYFVVVNPIVEELFWRVFLLREIGARFFLKKVVCHDSVNRGNKKKRRARLNMGNDDNHSLSPNTKYKYGAIHHEEHNSTALEGRKSSYTNISETEVPGQLRINYLLSSQSISENNGRVFKEFILTNTGNYIISLFYASYHVIVVLHMLGILYSVIIFAFLVALGVLLIEVKTRPNLGIVVCIFIHVGVDFGVVASYADAFLS